MAWQYQKIKHRESEIVKKYNQVISSAIINISMTIIEDELSSK